MKSLCFYFQVHQPFRLDHYKVQQIGEHHEYFDDLKNKEIFRKVAEKCYLPTNALLLKLCKQYPEFRASFSLSGVFLDHCELWGMDVLDSFKALAKTDQIEFLSETAYHSLAGIYSKKEFADQITKHREMIKTHFGIEPTIFRNTELIYSNEIAEFIRQMGFKGILAEGADHILDWRSPNHLYQSLRCELQKEIKSIAKKHNINQQKKVGKRTRRLTQRELPLLLKNYKLSDDIAFRFSNKGWTEHPLSSEKFGAWIDAAEGETINLFMDYETFGEHQWEDTGIFQFLENLPKALKERNIGFRTPSEVIAELKPIAEIDMHLPVSWADMERDLSAWNGNNIQKAALETIYALEPKIDQLKKLSTLDSRLLSTLDTWRKLQISDQFYYMSTKHWTDGDVHKYFSPFDSPYDAYIYFMNALTDFEQQIDSSLKN
ncbi:MAG: glycoside hydrolase family 57 protein [Candidatus Gracilibacteria bacterium]|nr:glycoside hydrolase family 57 protein [bacterium]MDZ4216969.1 glycoside hydrolase family 57 protein [Candidatus Gracilibacteria bacterium]